MSKPLLSKTMVITLDGSALAKTNGYSFTVDRETVDVTTFDSSNSWKEFLIDLKEAELTFDSLVARDSLAGTLDYETLLINMITTDSSVAVILNDTAAPTDILFSGFVTNLSLTATLGDKQTFSGTIKPTGAITIV